MIDGLLHREHTPYRQIGFQAVDYTLERAGISHTADEVAALVSAIERLRPFPDVVAALGAMKAAGLQLFLNVSAVGEMGDQLGRMSQSVDKMITACPC